MKFAKPSQLEMQVLSVLWKSGPQTARQILDVLPDGKDRAYTTVLSVMQVMEKKGLLTHETKGNRHIYAPLVKRREIIGPYLQSMVSHIFGGKPSLVMQHLLETNEVTAHEIEEIKKVLNDYDKRHETSKEGQKS